MLFLKMWFLADGTKEYGQTIRWLYLYGYLGKDPKATNKVEKLDDRNFKKWKKNSDGGIQDYLKVVRV
jgi:hypothetical protein